jgi:hypothetical protein
MTASRFGEALETQCFEGGTKTPVLENYAMGAIVGRRGGLENVSAGWELRCGDDGSNRSRGTLPSPSKPTC